MAMLVLVLLIWLLGVDLANRNAPSRELAFIM
jgi:hypothetical protein